MSNGAKNDFDCIVIGAGHAGIEAAHAAAIMGAKTLLLTISKNTIAQNELQSGHRRAGKGSDRS